MYNYKVYMKLFSDDETKAFFGNGPVILLQNIHQTKSISKAAKDMNMAYSKAFRMIKDAEQKLGFALLHSHSGGKKGGSSHLTSKAIDLIRAYRTVDYALQQKAKELYDQHIAPLIE